MPFAPRSDSPNSSWPFVGSEDEWPFTTVDTWPFGNGTSWPFDETPGDPPEITTSSLPNGTDGEAYSETLAVDTTTPGTNPWSISSGSLPSGLSLNASTGEISGTPDTVETANFTVKYTDQYGREDTQALSIEVEAGVIEAELDFAALSNQNPFVAADYDWTSDYKYSGSDGSRILSGKWTTQSSYSGESIHADSDFIDMDGESKVYAEMYDPTEDGSQPKVGLLVDYSPGSWYYADLDTFSGYLCWWDAGSFFVQCIYNGFVYQTVQRGLGAEPEPDKLTLKVTIGGSSNTVQVFADDSQVYTDYTDNHANRPTNLRTLAASLRPTSSSPSVTKIKGGTFT